MIKILTEDTYGTKFFEKIANKLEVKVKVKAERISGVCSGKMTRQIKACINDCDKIIVIVDGDGNPEDKEKTVREKHFNGFDEDKQKKLDVVVFEYEVEEWICTSLGIKFNSKPSEALDEWEKKQKGDKAEYEKKYLPEYVEKLDFGKLKDCNSFKKFKQLLNG